MVVVYCRDKNKKQNKKTPSEIRDLKKRKKSAVLNQTKRTKNQAATKIHCSREWTVTAQRTEIVSSINNICEYKFFAV